ncbi:MAG: DUF559 domain-containing protein [Acidimicrobiales bacterium]
MGAHYSVISLGESRAVGATYSVMRWKVMRGELDMPCVGVFRSTSAPHTPHQNTRVAYLASGGLVSDASGAWLWDLLNTAPDRPFVRTTGRMRKSSTVPFIVHESSDLDMSTGSSRYGMLVTKPMRTLVDLAGTGTDGQLVEAVDRALVTRLVSVAGIEAEIDRLSKRGRNGVGRLREHLADHGYLDAPSQSVLEARAWRLVRRIGIPLPVPQVEAGDDGQYRLDLAWLDIMFAIELDGYAWHHSPEQKRRDELRRQRLREAGWTVLVFDWWQLTKQPDWVIGEIRTTYQRLVARASQ